jgi:hypothetical protein
MTQRACIILYLACFIGTIFTLTSVAKAGVNGEENTGPRITFEKVFHDFGRVREDRELTTTFRFTNTGDDTLHIKSVRKT